MPGPVRQTHERSSAPGSLVAPGISSRRHPIAVIAAAVLTVSSVALALSGGSDVYPLSRYPMYSTPKDGLGTTSMVYWRGLTKTGSELRLAPPVSRQAALNMIAAENLQELESLARHAALQVPDVVRVLVLRQRVGIAAYPESVDVVVLDSKEVLAVDLSGP